MTGARRILGYSWQDHVSNQEVLRRAGMSRVTCLIRERQLRFYGHVVRFPMDDPAHRILNVKDPVEWTRRRGRPYSSWLAQSGDHMKEWSMGLAQARKRPREWSRKVSAAECRRGTCSHTWPDLINHQIFYRYFQPWKFNINLTQSVRTNIEE